MAMRIGEEKWVKITPKPSKARDLEKIAIKNDWFRNRDHALTARLLMNWGLSKGELNHFAGMHSLIPKEAHAFIPKKHVEALIEAEHPQKLIPPQVHTQENGNLLDYFRKLKPTLPQNGVAAHIRGIREKTGIPEEEREIKTALLGKLFKRGKQNLSLKELGEVEEYMQQLNSYVKSLRGREKQESQNYLFGRINANIIIRYIRGSKIANWQIKRAIAKAAEQTTLGRQLMQTRRGKFTKKAAALLAAAAIGFVAGTYRANVQQAALNQAKQGKPPITAPKTPGKGQTQKPQERQLNAEERLKYKQNQLYEKLNTAKTMEALRRNSAGAYTFSLNFIGLNAEDIKKVASGDKTSLQHADNVLNFFANLRIGSATPNPNARSETVQYKLWRLKTYRDAIETAAKTFTPEEIDLFLKLNPEAKKARETKTGQDYQSVLSEFVK